MSSATNNERSRSGRRHRSYRDRDTSESQRERIAVPVSDPPSSPRLERQPTAEPRRTRTSISRPKKQSRRQAPAPEPEPEPPVSPSRYSHGIAHHIATGEVGLDYGPYQVRPLQENL